MDALGALNALLEGLKALGAARLGALAAVAIGMFGLLAVLVMHGGNDHMALLYADLDVREAGQMGEALDRAHIPHQLNSTGSELLVPEEAVSRARLLLARDGLPSGGSIGYEIFDRGDSLTASQFQQSINQTRALEGELSRTIRTINGVRAARVHLVLSHREPFERSRQDAQASVMLTLAGANRLDREGIQAIVNLVAAAVPSLRSKNIAIIDSRGNVLARAGEATDAAAAAQSGDEMRHATELRLARAVEQMLERTLGPGRVRAEAAVDMNFEQIHETQERFDPDGQVVRSTQSANDTTKSTEANPNVSVQNNLPNADAGGAAGSGSQEQKQDETTNYEIGKTVRTLVREQPQIQKLSLAVLVDGTETKAPDGTVTWKERSPEELARIATLVRGAIGYDEKRGDHVEVVSMRFASEGGEAGAEPRTVLGIAIEKADVMKLAQTALIGVVGLAGLLLVLRPMVLRLSAGAGTTAMLSGGGDAAAVLSGFGPGVMLASAGGEALTDGGAGAMPRIAGPGGGLVSSDAGGGDAMVTMTNVEGQLRLSSVRKVVELVQRHPEESLSIVRAWMQQESSE